MIGLFDVDGTILDSMSIYENLGYNYLKSLGICANGDLNEILYPMTFRQSATYLKKHYLLKASIDDIMLSLQNNIYDYYKNKVLLKDGIREVLETLYQLDYPLYIVTSSTKELVDISFNRLKINHYFRNIYTCDDLLLSKEDKRFYLEIMNQLQVDAKDCIVFEDNAYSALAAKQCGIRVIGIKDQYARGNIESIADIYIENWRDLNENSFNDCR
ncbi:MAG: HAD family hydrolase [Erysipelotrichaceae bacterium]|nr:HAD family hydrolase [Erysipelotrichaceae bacterium]